MQCRTLSWASRIELKGWGCWRNTRGTGITLDDAKQLNSDTKTRIKLDDLNMSDLPDRDQGNFDIMMMVFLWFNDGVTPMIRERVQLDLQQSLASAPMKFRDVNVGATLELNPEKRPLNQGPDHLHRCDEGTRWSPA